MQDRMCVVNTHVDLVEFGDDRFVFRFQFGHLSRLFRFQSQSLLFHPHFLRLVKLQRDTQKKTELHNAVREQRAHRPLHSSVLTHKAIDGAALRYLGQLTHRRTHDFTMVGIYVVGPG